MYQITNVHQRINRSSLCTTSSSLRIVQQISAPAYHVQLGEGGTRSLQQICAFCALPIVRIITDGGGANQSLPDIALEWAGSNETPLTSALNITLAHCCGLYTVYRDNTHLNWCTELVHCIALVHCIGALHWCTALVY